MSRKPADDFLFERATVPEWEELFNRKCDELRNKIAVFVYEIVFTTEGKYACKKCKCRIKIRVDEEEYCIRCSPLSSWGQDIKDRIKAIFQQYPTKEECKDELKAKGKNTVQPFTAKKDFRRF
jgi:hypothetical protein